MASYKNVEFDETIVGLVRNMNSVEEYRETLHGLQTVWDNLTLLGQMSGTGTDMSSTRQEFNQLTHALLNELSKRTFKKCVVEMAAKAQVAIDILVRNLFERTADIGFLATDQDIRLYLAARRGKDSDEATLEREKVRLRARFAEYIAKYSVYSDIVLLDPAGAVLVRLDERAPVAPTNDTWFGEALTSDAAYVEYHGYSQLFPQQKRSLLYAYRVTDEQGTAMGVLCLCFRLENELERIFDNLTGADDWAVILLLDANGVVIGTSDESHIAPGTQLETVLDEACRVVRFAGREYLATTRPTQGYQGYFGPGWVGHVMLPVQHAFNKDSSKILEGIDRRTLRSVMGNSALFSAELRSIPAHADRIQRNLNRSVWNGNIRQRSGQRSSNQSFSKILLWEISNTGNRTREVFSQSIANLYETVISSILQDGVFFASLAIDIMDRNLYERADDCRWWALTSAFREIMGEPELSVPAQETLTALLRRINALYPVYSNLIVFDCAGRVVAVSQAAASGWVGKVVDEAWVRAVLDLKSSQDYAVSEFSETSLYAGRHTYIYGAPIRSLDESRVVGGIGIVFDSEPQFAAMLCDALPRDDTGNVASGTFGLFAGPDGSVIASSSPSYAPGDKAPVARTFLAQTTAQGCASIVSFDGNDYAVGACASSGYREYKGEHDPYRNPVTALIFVPLCKHAEGGDQPIEIKPPVVRSDAAGSGVTVEVATFRIGSRWFGMFSEQIAESMNCEGTVSVPGAGSELAGYFMYQGAPIPVFDVSRIVNAGEASRYPSPQVIVLNRANGAHFGILADDLGEIPEVLLSRIQALPTLIAGGNVLAESIVMTDKPEAETLLVILGVERIAARLTQVEPPDARGLEVAQLTQLTQITPLDELGEVAEGSGAYLEDLSDAR